MAKQDKSKLVPYVQELTVTSAAGVETVRTLDTAWHLMLERAAQHGPPVTTRFVGLVRADE